jgi:ribosomal protein S8E
MKRVREWDKKKKNWSELKNVPCVMQRAVEASLVVGEEAKVRVRTRKKAKVKVPEASKVGR